MSVDSGVCQCVQWVTRVLDVALVVCWSVGLLAVFVLVVVVVVVIVVSFWHVCCFAVPPSHTHTRRPVHQGHVYVSTLWPSGLRRWTQVPLSSDAWVRTPQVSYSSGNVCAFLLVGGR